MGKLELHGAFTMPSVVAQFSSPTFAPSGKAQLGDTRHSSGTVIKNAWKLGWSAGSLISYVRSALAPAATSPTVTAKLG